MLDIIYGLLLRAYCPDLIEMKVKGGQKMQGYCMKCRAKKDMKDAQTVTMANGKKATQGVCPVCGTKMFKIMKG